MARSMPAYRCILLDDAGVPTTVVHLMVESDADAIIASITLAREDRHCRGFEIREAQRLVFLQMDERGTGRRRGTDQQAAARREAAAKPLARP